MSKLYEMATNPEKWPLEKIANNWLWPTNTNGKEFYLLNATDATKTNTLSYVISFKLMTEAEIRMYMLFCFYAAEDENNE